MSNLINDLLDSIAQIIANDNPIKSYCHDKFAKYQTIMIGLEPETEPEANNYPLIAIANITNPDRGDGFSQDSLVFGICTTIECRTLESSTINGISIKKWLGFAYVEDLRRIVENSILNTTGLAWQISVSGQNVQSTFFPYFSSISITTFSRPKNRRDGRGFGEE